MQVSNLVFRLVSAPVTSETPALPATLSSTEAPAATDATDKQSQHCKAISLKESKSAKSPAAFSAAASETTIVLELLTSLTSKHRYSHNDLSNLLKLSNTPEDFSPFKIVITLVASKTSGVPHNLCDSQTRRLFLFTVANDYKKYFATTFFGSCWCAFL